MGPSVGCAQFVRQLLARDAVRQGDTPLLERTLVPDVYRPARRAARAGITVLAGLGLVAGIAVPLSAAHADPVYPSADQVAGAQAAAASAADQVTSLDQQLAASRDRLDALQQDAGNAAEADNGGGDTGQLDIFFGGGGPQEVLDKASGIQAVGAERARMVQEAESARLIAANLQQVAAEAEGRRATAATAAKAAADKARQAAQDAE